MPNDTDKTIDLIYVEIVGSDYSVKKEAEIRNALQGGPYAVIVRGRHSIAAGAGLAYDIVVFVAGALASGFLYDLLKSIVSRMKKAFLESGESNVPLNRVTFRTKDCDLVISANCNADTYSEAIDYRNLLSQMGLFVEDELRNGHPVMRIETPCELHPNGQGWDCACCGIGNYSLWKVEYKSGDRWPEILYDAANKSFIGLLDNELSTLPPDLFYSGEIGGC